MTKHLLFCRLRNVPIFEIDSNSISQFFRPVNVKDDGSGVGFSYDNSTTGKEGIGVSFNYDQESGNGTGVDFNAQSLRFYHIKFYNFESSSE